MFALRRLLRASTSRRSLSKAQPRLEPLESRVVLTYSLSGNQWPHPELITLKGHAEAVVSVAFSALTNC